MDEEFTFKISFAKRQQAEQIINMLKKDNPDSEIEHTVQAVLEESIYYGLNQIQKMVADGIKIKKQSS